MRDAARSRAQAAGIDVSGLPELRTALRKELSRAGRQGEPLSCLGIGIDGIGPATERSGELRHEVALAGVTRALRDAVRIYDMIARYRADELVVVLPNTDLGTAVALAERLRHTLRGTGRETIASSIVISVGVAAATGETMTGEALLERATEGLRAAREGGGGVASVQKGRSGSTEGA